MNTLTKDTIESIVDTMGNDNYEMENARVSLIVNDPSTRDGWRAIMLAESPDVYEALWYASRMLTGTLGLGDIVAMMAETTGWAAPLPAVEDGTPPSQADDRQRVKLFMFIDPKYGVSSALMLSERKETLVSMDEQMEGDLYETVIAAMENYLINNGGK